MITKLLLYCTKSKPYLLREDIDKDLVFIGTNKTDVVGKILNGKVVGECDYEVEKIQKNWRYEDYYNKELLKKSCLSYVKIKDYLSYNNGYAIHIKNLHIFDEPKELNEYYKSYDNSKTWKPITKAPQNMMYVDYINIEKDKFIPYFLISIHPEWLCKILNGEKTIEIRKKVLKKML